MVRQVTCGVCESSRLFSGSGPATVDYSWWDIIGTPGAPVSVIVCQNPKAIQVATERWEQIIKIMIGSIESAITSKDFACQFAQEDE